MADQQRTRDDIETLKAVWLKDPCWDIEQTEGFEAHREELAAFHEQKRQEWKAKAEQRLQERAARMGIPDNLELAKYIIELEQRLSSLEQDRAKQREYDLLTMHLR